MGDDDDISTANTMRGRGDTRDKWLLLLMRVDRVLFTAGLTVLVFAAFVAVVGQYEAAFVQQVRQGDLIDTLFTSMITAIVTGATLVVSIAQLVLSQENGPLGDQRSRMSATMDYREYLGEILGGTVPADPSAFLGELIEETADRAETVQARLAGKRNEDLASEAEQLTDSIIGNADEVTDQLDGASFGSFDVLFAALNFNYSWKIFQVERLMTEYEGTLDSTDEQRLYDLKTALTMFGPAREHIKTLYFQWELIDFSRLTLYTAVPALVVSGIMVAVVDVATVSGSFLGVAYLTLLVGGAFSFTLVPFLLFVAYLLRILTVAKRTLAIGPLILRDSQR
jgi:hypothetical protein